VAAAEIVRLDAAPFQASSLCERAGRYRSGFCLDAPLIVKAAGFQTALDGVKAKP